MKAVHRMVLAVLLAGLQARFCAGSEAGACGDQPLACGENQKCCEHVIALFSADGSSAPSYVEGRCVPQDHSCGDFWCGNRHCEPGFFGSPTVCCVIGGPGVAPDYRCAHSELSCPGNADSLSIRQHASARRLQGY